MAVQLKGPDAIIKKRDTVETKRDPSGRSVTFRSTEVHEGPYARLVAKRNAVWASASTTTLVPTTAGHGMLTIVYEETREVPQKEGDEPPPPSYEVISQEVRQPIHTAPAFKDLTAEARARIDAAIAGEAAPPTTAGAELDLYTRLARGQTEWVTGAPVVRATETGLTTKPASEAIWVRDNPPSEAGAPGGYDYLLTASEVRGPDNGTYTRVREWTGAKEWDQVIYPSS
jgi:hypothetical protein